MSLFRRLLLTLWPKRREEGAVAPVITPETPDGSICIVAGGAFVVGLDCAQSTYVLTSTAGGAHTIGQDVPGDGHTIGPTAGGHHIIGQDVKGTANCEC